VAPEGKLVPEDRRADSDLAEDVRSLCRSGRGEEAYTRLVEATADPLYRFLRRFLRDEEAAREVFQETYLRVFRSLDTFRGEARLTTWVLAIGRNQALNHLRRVKTRREDPLPEEPLPATRPGSRGEGSVLTRSLAGAVERLPAPERDAVLLFYGEDRSVAEISSLVGRPANTVKSDLLRARNRLREALGRKESLTEG
jgi:RNA polymerase sigma-70 factor (ECF subfamily)